jgi:hypothetical protein
VECLLWDAVAASLLALARFWATEVEARSDRWRLGHRRCCSRWTVYVQLDSHDRVAISIDLRELIEAGSVHDRFGVIGCNVPT